MDAWIEEYLDALPDTIRTDSRNVRLILAAAAAAAKGWTGRQAANVIRSRNYAGKRNPPLIALMELETLAARPPATSRPVTSRINASGCHVCPPGATCDNPVTEPMNPAWNSERAQLLKQLMASPDLTEDQREHAMATLIGRQRAT